MSVPFLNLRARWDQAFRFPRDFSAYDSYIVGGASIYLVFTFAGGRQLIFSSETGDGIVGGWNYDAEKIGWFTCSLADLAAFYAEFYGSTNAQKASWVCRIEKDGDAQVVMAGNSIWALPGIALASDASADGVDVFGATVFVDGETDGSGYPLPVEFTTAAAAALTSVLTAKEQFDAAWVGAYANSGARPTLDASGNALASGALGWNIATKQMEVYNGSGWDDWLPGPVTLSGATTLTAAHAGRIIKSLLTDLPLRSFNRNFT